MSLINPVWLDFDKHTKALNASGWYATCEDTIDNKIISDCIQRGITIPTDGVTGFIDSPFLRSVAVDYAVFMLLVGNWGVRSEDDQVYRDKAQYHWSQYDKAIKNLCPTLV
jgi:hypothetical protein